jgi:hypothetical protein
MIQELLKQKHLAREEGQLERQIGLEGKQVGLDTDRAQLEAIRSQPELLRQKAEREAAYNNARLAIQRQAETGRITRAEADRQQRELDRRSREQIAADRIASSERAAGARGNGEAVRQAKASAAQEEFDQLVNDERGAGEEKNRAYAYLEQLKANAPKDEFSGELTDQAKADIRQATDAAQAADKLYQSFAEKKRDAQRRVRENQVSASPTTTQPYAGRTMSAANLARYAKDKGMTIEAARTKLEKEDGIVIR